MSVYLRACTVDLMECINNKFRYLYNISTEYSFFRHLFFPNIISTLARAGGGGVGDGVKNFFLCS